MVSTAEHLRKLAMNFPEIGDHLQRIRQEEHEADDLAHQALDRLDRTFITPFDREDIHTLVGGLDDIVDTIDALAKRFPLYHVKCMEPAFVKQTEVLVEATMALARPSSGCARAASSRDLSDRLIEIHRLENVGDDNNHAAVSKLFDGNTDAAGRDEVEGTLRPDRRRPSTAARTWATRWNASCSRTAERTGRIARAR